MGHILDNLKDLSFFLISFSLVLMTVLSSYSSNIGIEHNLNTQAQTPENNQLPQQQLLSSLTTPPQTGTMPAIKITSHSSGQQVKVGPLTISGTSSDTLSTDCEVYADWNDNMPFRKAVAAGPGGPDDYSKWTFTYNNSYHLIQNGTNNLTSKISCADGPTNLTKWNSVNLIGVNSSDSGPAISQAITGGLTPSLPSPSSTTALPTPSQAGITSSPLDPVVGEVEEENEENDDSESDNSNDDEDNNSSEDGDSGDNGDDENGDGDDDDGDDDDGDSLFDDDSFFD